MIVDKQVDVLLPQFDKEVSRKAGELREIIFANLPDIAEQLDIRAKMVAYCYGQKYSELICVMIPSKKG